MNGDVIDFEHAVEDLLVREAREEAGIEIARELAYLDSVAFVRPDETPVILLFFASKYVSGDVVPETGSFTECAWVNADEIANYPCIDGVPDDIVKTIILFQ